MNSAVVDLVEILQSVGMIVDREDHSVFGAHQHPLQLLVLNRVGGLETVFKIEICEDGVSGVLVEDNGRSLDEFVLYTPESDVFFAARGEFEVVEGREF